MRMRWMGITGMVLIVSALVLNILGPRLLPTAFWDAQRFGMLGNQMMGSGMMMGDG